MNEQNNTYEFNIDELLNLFDKDKKEEKNSTSGINAILGEELGAGIFLDYLKRYNSGGRIIGGEPIESNDSKRLDSKSEEDRKYKKKLDRWIKTSDKLYQVEIKNWNTNSLNVYDKSIKDDESNLCDACKVNFKNHFYIDNREVSLKHTSTAKVLLKMDSSKIKVEENKSYLTPLLIFWFPIHSSYGQSSNDNPEDDAKKHYMFEVEFSNRQKHGERYLKANKNKKKGDFKDDAFEGDYNKLTVFSMSLYLRHLRNDKNETKINLELPWFNETMSTLKRIGAIKEPENKAVNNISINIYN